MGYQIILNIVIAGSWVLLTDSWSIGSFIAGYFIGVLLLIIFRNLFPSPLYIRKIWAICKLLLLFNKELILSTFAVVREVVRPRLQLKPGIFAYETELKTDLEITLLGCFITLTPGTLTIEVSPDQRTLYIHAMDLGDVEQTIQSIRHSFERAIMEVTRTC